MKRILVVDDDASVRQVLRCRLEHNGYEVLEASNGVEAFANAKDKKPDLILLDVMMPVMDGYSLMEEMKWEDDIKKIPILVLSGRTEIKDVFAARGSIHFLAKPFETRELLDMVSTCAGH